MLLVREFLPNGGYGEHMTPKKSTTKDGVIHYRLGGQLHNWEDKPAVIYPNGRKDWYYAGELHRETGPAITADMYGEVYLFAWRGSVHTFDEWCELARLSEEEKVLMALVYK